MISIIIPLYNQAEKLSKTLQSLEKQTEQDYEIIIVNDGSKDNYQEVVKKYQTRFKRFKIIEQKNQGANSARNRGTQEADGEFLLFSDADLVFKSYALEIMLSNLAKHPEVSYVYSSFKYGLKLFKLWPWDADRLRKMPYIHTTSLLRKKNFPGFDEKMKRLQDWDLWLTMLEQGKKGLWIPQVLFTVHPGGKISSWFPKIIYKLFPKLRKVQDYQQAVQIIKKKHHLQ